jgi:GxxExxY protein
MPEIIYKDESYAIMGACFEVYKEKGCGFNETVFQECLEIELGVREIPFKAQVEMPLSYKGHVLKSKFKTDLICYDKIIVELKAVSALVPEHRAQVLNYLNASKLELGLLVNFGHYPKVEHERLALTEKSFRALSRFSRAEEIEL